MVRIEVADRGPGVSEKVQASLFTPFMSADRAHGGSGLGLAIARELARGMGGDVTLLRSGPQGAAFCVTLAGA
jgi:signal transduction histidine kinase